MRSTCSPEESLQSTRPCNRRPICVSTVRSRLTLRHSVAVSSLRNRKSQRKTPTKPRRRAIARLIRSRRELKTLQKLNKKYRTTCRPSNLRSKELRSSSRRRRNARNRGSRKRRPPSNGHRSWLRRKKKRGRKGRSKNARPSSNEGRKRRCNASRGWSKK